MSLLWRLFLCIVAASAGLYLYIDGQNDITHLRLTIPQLERELRHIREVNTRLEYEIDRFESPIHLMRLAREPAFRHLRHPYVDEVMVIADE